MMTTPFSKFQKGQQETEARLFLLVNRGDDCASDVVRQWCAGAALPARFQGRDAEHCGQTDKLART